MPKSVIDSGWEKDFSYHTQWFKSPGYLSCEVPLAVRDELSSSMANHGGDARSTLRGHLKEEWHLEITPEVKKFTRCLGYEYIKRFGLQPSMGMAESMRDIEDTDLELKRLWVNYQKKYDFNIDKAKEIIKGIKRNIFLLNLGKSICLILYFFLFR